MTEVHDMRLVMAQDGNAGSDWLIGMHTHFGQTGEYRSSDVYRLLGDQRLSFDLAGAQHAVLVCHEAPAEQGNGTAHP